MKCDRCNREATLHDLKLIKGGVVSEVHLCEKCATELGFVGKNYTTVDELLQQAIAQQAGVSGVSIEISSGGAATSGAKSNVCPNCSLTWSEFRERGLLGCPQCYATFEDKLGPLLERAHEGGTHHVGKCPSREGKRIDVEARLGHLKKQLVDAVASEQYERAAQIRDAIRELTGQDDESDSSAGRRGVGSSAPQSNLGSEGEG